LVTDVANQLKKNKFASFKVPGRDEFYLIPQSSLDINDLDEYSFDMIDRDSSNKFASEIFTKTLNSSKSSRILLTKFIEKIA
jgi:hypothetical protein